MGKVYLEIGVIVIILIVSFITFTGGYANNFSNAVKVDKGTFEVLTKRTEEDQNLVLKSDDILDSSHTYLQNYTDKDAKVQVILKLKAQDGVNINLISFKINDATYDVSDASFDGEYYEWVVDNADISKKNVKNYDVLVMGDAMYINSSLINYEIETVSL